VNDGSSGLSYSSWDRSRQRQPRQNRDLDGPLIELDPDAPVLVRWSPAAPAGDRRGESSGLRSHDIGVAELPSGTVTFLFTDVEGSTRLLHELGDGYVDVLAEHRRALRKAFAGNGGVEVDTQGDAFFVAFARASDALNAAAQGREGLVSGPIKVRMGLHTGEPVVTDEGYVGIDVHRAARIAAAGHGGQILVSRSTRDLAGALSLRDLGEHRLKDLTAPERLYQLGDDDFPPLKSLNATNLPVAANSLVGRARELAELAALFRDSARLVTLTGAGGSGKTRLGLQVAAELVEDFPGGVFFVPLAGVGHPDLVESTIAATIGVRKLADLSDRHALILVDNFEHLLDAAPAVGSLLSAASQARVLVTSRAPLRLEGEQEYAIDPLPDADAIELLTQRARAVRRDFEPDEAAREICRRLDGLPLALELVASRLRSLGSAALLERLDRRLPLLTGGRRDAPDRQRTLRATIEWSYDLLPPELRRVFERLAVFAGTFSLEAGEAVADATLDDLDALVEASLLKAVGEDRFLILETIREFAGERFEKAADVEDVGRRHADHYLRIAEEANLSGETERAAKQHDVAELELDNFRKAVAWAVEGGDVASGLRIVIALDTFWVARDPFEGRSWFAALLAKAKDVPPDLHARALLTCGGLVFIVGEFEQGTKLYEESLAEYAAIGDERGRAEVLGRLANSALAIGDYVRARELAEESLELHRRFGSRKGEAGAFGTIANIEWRTGAHQLARVLAEKSAAMAAETGFLWWQVGVLSDLCEWSFQDGRPDDADRFGREALALAHRIGDRMHGVYLLALLARGAAEDGRLERAGVLWGALETEEERGIVGQWESERELYAAPVLAHAGGEFERGRSEGRRLSLDDAVAVALAEPR
jgi:predicted ATPase/class 3 adenylate cyclase